MTEPRKFWLIVSAAGRPIATYEEQARAERAIAGIYSSYDYDLVEVQEIPKEPK